MEGMYKSLTRTADKRNPMSIQPEGETKCPLMQFYDRERMLAAFKNASEDVSYVIKRHTKNNGTNKECNLLIEDFDALFNYATITYTSATVEVAITGDATDEQKADTVASSDAPVDAEISAEKKVYTNYFLDTIKLSRTGMLEFDRLCK